MFDYLAAKVAVFAGAFLAVELWDAGHGLEQELITAGAAAGAVAFLWTRVIKPALARVFRAVLDDHPLFDHSDRADPKVSIPKRLDAFDAKFAESQLERQALVDRVDDIAAALDQKVSSGP